MINMASSDNPRFAHFENISTHSLYDLYIRHAEIARDIHQDILRRGTGNNSLSVELVTDSPVLPTSIEDTINKLQQYDVVSVSSGVELGAIINSRGLSNPDIINQYRQAFSEEDMPIYIVALFFA